MISSGIILTNIIDDLMTIIIHELGNPLWFTKQDLVSFWWRASWWCPILGKTNCCKQASTTMQTLASKWSNLSPADLDCSGIARAPMPNPVWRRLCQCVRGHCDWQTLTRLDTFEYFWILLDTFGYFWSLEPMFDSFVMWWVETLLCNLASDAFPASDN